MYFNIGDSPLEIIADPMLDASQITLYIKREDKLHPEVGGNKWRKLKYNLMEARKKGHHTLLTFGGAYSNHVYAVAAAGAELGFKTIGIIRGEPTDPLNTTLSFAVKKGMLLHFTSRQEYQLKDTYQFQKQLYNQFGDFYLIPEGGSNVLGAKGCIEIIEDISIPYDFICTGCGTGSTLAGLVAGLDGDKKAMGFSSLKGTGSLKGEISKLVHDLTGKDHQNWEIINSYHFGGYAKYTPELIEFINRFKNDFSIPLDPVYTGKMMFGIFDLVKNGYFPDGSVIVAVHTGGLQGIAGFNERFGDIIST